MKIPRRWFSRSNFVLSHLRTATAVTLISAAAAMAFVARGDNEEEVLRQVTEHARTTHKMSEIPAEVRDKVVAAIRDEAA